MKRLLCKIGIHGYDYDFKAKNPMDETDYQDSTRVCRHCGKSQLLDVHCLGMNPPAYVKTWYNNPKAEQIARVEAELEDAKDHLDNINDLIRIKEIALNRFSIVRCHHCGTLNIKGYVCKNGCEE